MMKKRKAFLRGLQGKGCRPLMAVRSPDMEKNHEKRDDV